MNFRNIFNKIRLNGGITVNKNGNEYKGLGYAVAIGKDTEIIIDNDLFIPELIQAVSRKYAKQLENKNIYLGIWQDQNKVYFDLSEIVTSKQEAIKKANDRKQLAIFDFNSKQVIDIIE